MLTPRHNLATQLRFSCGFRLNSGKYVLDQPRFVGQSTLLVASNDEPRFEVERQRHEVEHVRFTIHDVDALEVISLLFDRS